MAPAPPHLPVLLEAVVRVLRPAGRRVLLDCTIGAGGHAEALLEAAGPDARLIGVDVDEASLALARDKLRRFAGRVRLFQANFADVRQVLREAGVERADLLLADLGVSSSQLDDPRRGLSFSSDGPLDMRLDRRARYTAADLVNRLDQSELADVIYRYGQERYSRRIARAIVEARRRRRIERTAELAEIVARAYPAPARRTRRGVHPATRTFQAIRIATNDEMVNLDRLLAELPAVLAVGGRAGIIAFHSLEDGRVKRSFAGLAKAKLAVVLTAKPIVPTPEEIAANARCRSSRFRAIERIGEQVLLGGGREDDQGDADWPAGRSDVHRDVRPGPDGADRDDLAGAGRAARAQPGRGDLRPFAGD